MAFTPEQWHSLMEGWAKGPLIGAAGAGNVYATFSGFACFDVMSWALDDDLLNAFQLEMGPKTARRR